MKISAIPQAQGGNPSQNLLSNANGTASPQKRAAAIQIALGQEPTETHVDPQVAKVQASIHKIQMKTNRSPAPREYPQVEESTVSDPTEQVPAVTEATQPLSPQFAALAKQKRALQVKERELADREKALTSQPATDGSSDLVERLKSSPLSVLQEHGVTYDQLTDAILASQNQNPDILALQKEIKALKEGVDKSLSDREAQAEAAVLAEMQKEAEALIAEGDEFEMVRETKSLPDAMDLIKRTYKETGEVLEVSEALRLCEEELLNESLKVASFKKVQSKLAPQPVTQQPQKTLKTLTNRDSSVAPLDRKARALAAFYGNLKN